MAEPSTDLERFIRVIAPDLCDSCAIRWATHRVSFHLPEVVPGVRDTFQVCLECAADAADLAATITPLPEPSNGASWS